MFKGLIGRKIGMTQIFDVNGAAVPVTLLEAGPCFVSQVKTAETDGYNAVQLAFGEVKPKRLTKAHLGHLKTNDLPPVRVLREFRTKKLDGVSAGDKLDASVFAEGEHVDVVGISKGKGFAGAMKRHGFAGGPRTHGQSDRQRSPGSSASSPRCGSSPSRVSQTAWKVPIHLRGSATLTACSLDSRTCARRSHSYIPPSLPRHSTRRAAWRNGTVG